MMQKLLVFVLFLGSVACSSSKKPEGVLTQAQLSNLLIDVYLSEARIESITLPKDSLMRFFVPHEQKILQARGIPDSILKITYEYYLAHTKELEQVYDAMIDTLVLRDQRIKQLPSTAVK
jgi:hypothetical protein